MKATQQNDTYLDGRKLRIYIHIPRKAGAVGTRGVFSNRGSIRGGSRGWGGLRGCFGSRGGRGGKI